MAMQDRTAPHFPTPEEVALWSRQMLEMQHMLMHSNLLGDGPAPKPKIEDDDEDDLWDNMPV